MNKTELSAAVAAKANLSKKDAEKIVGAFLDTIVETLQKDEKVQLVGFGTFETKHRPARKARNPRTGEEIDIPPSTSASFKPGKQLREALQS
ncbi:MAG: HU family DNA-binding protein [Oscillospiraceae bacterium]|nr:HU family DNA-binding protein [Oscillospiraceae bacterium]